MKILHVFDHSLPYFSGYSFRNRYILRMQKQLGLELFAVTSPKHEKFQNAREVIDGIDHYRTEWPELTKPSRLGAAHMVRQMTCLNVLSGEIARLADNLQIDLIHAHSPAVNGLASARAAAHLKLPWLYELHYYDEDAAVDRGKTRHNSMRYRLSQRFELGVLAQAKRIAVIGSGLRADLINRGVKESKIFEVPNGVDTEIFQPRQPDSTLMRMYGLSGKTVIGFIGSFYAYEGLDCLIRSMVELLRDRRDIKLVLAGDGEAFESINSLVPDDFREEIIFAGKVRHDEIQRYYSVMDIVVYPRVKSRLTDLTAPLKPLEAMSMGKPVVVSDVGGLLEIVKEGETGLVFESGNSSSLTKCLSKLIDGITERFKLGRRAREFTANNRDWRHIVTRYMDVYADLAGINNGRK